MADNVAITAGSGTTIATDDAGAGGHVQLVKLAISTDGSATLIPAEATNGLDVDVTRLPALVAGSANIGDVDVASIAAGDNNIGNVDIVTLPALVAGSANIGDVDVLSIIPGTGATNQGKAIDSAAGATDTGVAPLAIRDDALTTLTPVDGDWVPLRVNSVGGLYVDTGSTTAPTATLSNVSGSASSVTVLASNVLRKGAIMVNDSTAVCYLKFGSSASATSFTYKLAPDDTLEVPFGYTGILTGLWTSAVGSARVTEIT